MSWLRVRVENEKCILTFIQIEKVAEAQQIEEVWRVSIFRRTCNLQKHLRVKKQLIPCNDADQGHDGIRLEQIYDTLIGI